MSKLARQPQLVRRILASRIWGGGGWFMVPLALVYLLGVCLWLFVFVVDPFDLRPFGRAVSVEDRPYPDVVIPKMVSAVAKTNHDIVVVGASTSMGYTPEMLRRSFPNAKHPFNLSMGGLRANEQAIIVNQLLDKDPALKHLILVVDVTTLNDVNMMGRPLPVKYYQGRWYDLVPEFSGDAVGVSANVLRTGELNSPKWSKRGALPDWANGMRAFPDIPGGLAKLQHAADVTRASITEGAGPSCPQIEPLNDWFLPSVRKAAARGVDVDVLMAPFALSVYSDWQINWPPGNFIRGGGIYPHLMAVRRCTVEALDGTPHVRIHSFDADLGFIDRMENYHDSAHLIRPEAYQYVLDGIASRTHLLTRANFGAYSAKLEAAVHAFNPLPSPAPP